MSKTRKEIIDETATAYTLESRAVLPQNSGGGCAYVTEDGRMCAVGRCMITPSMAWDGYVAQMAGLLEERLKPEYRGHPVQFWGDLQGLHDDYKNWDDSGLSEEGQRAVDKLHSLYDEE